MLHFEYGSREIAAVKANDMRVDKLSREGMAGIILAGGLSTRMGRDKATLPWQESDLLNTVLAQLVKVCSELIIVSNVPRKLYLPNVKVIPDKYKQCGPLGGMQAGIAASTYYYNFITACDMPYLSAEAITYIGKAAAGYDAAIPFIDGFFNPLHGVYNHNCLPHIECMLQRGKYRILDFYGRVKLRKISKRELTQFDKDLRTLTNINTPDDLKY